MAFAVFSWVRLSVDVEGRYARRSRMLVAQWLVLGCTVIAAGVASFLYNDGRDRYLGAVVTACAVIGAVGIGLSVLAAAVTGPPTAVPSCDWSDLDDELRPRCESQAQAAARAAAESRQWLASAGTGIALETVGVTISGGIGLLVATATHHRPTDGRPRRLMLDD